MDKPAPSGQAASPPKTKAQEWKDTCKTLVYALLLALTFRSFAYEPFHIPSGSMKSNLVVGDYLFISKFSYGYSRFSFPWYMKKLPIKGRFWRSDPQRGDIIVFHPPGSDDLGDPYIKRLIGLPGDRIQVKEGVVHINGTPVKRDYADEWTDPEPAPDSSVTLSRYRETLPEGKSFLTLYEKPLGPMENTREYAVPAGHYFFMGDNRDHSADSRFDSPVGFVPEENLIGRADVIAFSWGGETFLRFSRFFNSLN